MASNELMVTVPEGSDLYVLLYAEPGQGQKSELKFLRLEGGKTFNLEEGVEGGEILEVGYGISCCNLNLCSEESGVSTEDYIANCRLESVRIEEELKLLLTLAESWRYKSLPPTNIEDIEENPDRFAIRRYVDDTAAYVIVRNNRDVSPIAFNKPYFFHFAKDEIQRDLDKIVELATTSLELARDSSNQCSFGTCLFGNSITEESKARYKQSNIDDQTGTYEAAVLLRKLIGLGFDYQEFLKGEERTNLYQFAKQRLSFEEVQEARFKQNGVIRDLISEHDKWTKILNGSQCVGIRELRLVESEIGAGTFGRVIDSKHYAKLLTKH